MNAIKQSKGFILFMLLASLLYLGFEIHFNAQLLEVASDINASDDDIDFVENFGRTMSGVGLVLILIGSFFNNSLKDTLFKLRLHPLEKLADSDDERSLKWLPLLLAKLISLGLIIVAMIANRVGTLDEVPAYIMLAFASLLFVMSNYLQNWKKWITILSLIAGFNLMFFGQKTAIDAYIEYSSVEARTNAYYMFLLKKALYNDVVAVEGLPFNSSNLDNPVTMTFVSLMGGLVSASPAFLDVISGKKDEIIGATIAKNSYKSLDSSYSNYKKVGNEIGKQWDWYKTKSTAMSRAGDDESSQQAFVDLLKQRDTMYEKYLDAGDNFKKAARKEADSMLPYLRRYHKAISDCNSASCQERYYNDFDKQMQKKFGESVPMFYFCVDVEEDMETKINNNLNSLFGLLKNARTVNQYSCRESDVTLELAQRRIMGLRLASFESKTGYPAEYLLDKNKAAFLTHAKTIKTIRDEVLGQNIQVTTNWDHTGRDEFVKAYAHYYKKNAKLNWNSESKKKLGEVVPPMLSYSQFVNHAVIQKKIKSLMGQYYIDGMGMEMSEKEFNDKVLKPRLARQVNKEVDRMNNNSKEFADGGMQEAEGKAMLRSVIVPPIALFISLLMVLVTVGKNGVAFVSVLQGLPCLRSTKAIKVLKTGFAAATGFVIFVVPFHASNSFADSESFKYFMNDYKKSSPIWSYSTEWVMRMEPIVYPVDQKLIDILNKIRDGEYLDKGYYTDTNSTRSIAGNNAVKSTGNQVIPSVSLYVSTNVSGAKIRIMTIKPAYYSGINVRLGSHRVVISKPGYETIDKTFTVTGDNRSMNLNFIMTRL